MKSQWTLIRHPVALGLISLAVLVSVGTVLALSMPEPDRPLGYVPPRRDKPENPFHKRDAEQQARQSEIERLAAESAMKPVPAGMQIAPDATMALVAGTYDLGGGWVVEITPYRGLEPALRVTRNGIRAVGMAKSMASACKGGTGTVFFDRNSGEYASVYVGTHGNDAMFCDNLASRSLMLGMGGHDVIHGSKGRDVIIGGDGHDTVYGNGGGDDIREAEELMSAEPGEPSETRKEGS